jgi:hypothetical protein
MKQAIDNQTIDMWEPTSHGGKSLYRFYVETIERDRVEWHGLTLTKAKQMYAYTNQSNPSNVTRCGWEEMK